MQGAQYTDVTVGSKGGMQENLRDTSNPELCKECIVVAKLL